MNHMNSFAHALPYLDDQYQSIGCFIPDILAAADRRCRARKKQAAIWMTVPEQPVAALAHGVVCHHEDDRWFHQSAMFNNLMVKLAVEFREQFERGHSMRPSLIAHIVIEMFLDQSLHLKFPGKLEQLYQHLESADFAVIENSINQFATRPTSKLKPALEFFTRERFLFDYATDEGVHYRMNRVLERVKLKPMPDQAVAWLGAVREEVEANVQPLLHQFGMPLDAEEAGKS